MTYRLDLRPRAERQLDMMPEKVATAILEFMLGTLLENPRRVGHPLCGTEEEEAKLHQ